MGREGNVGYETVEIFYNYLFSYSTFLFLSFLIFHFAPRIIDRSMIYSKITIYNLLNFLLTIKEGGRINARCYCNSMNLFYSIFNGYPAIEGIAMKPQCSKFVGCVKWSLSSCCFKLLTDLETTLHYTRSPLRTSPESTSSRAKDQRDG